MTPHDAEPPRWRRYLRFARPDARADVDEELEFHIAMRIERNLALGMTPEAARADATLRFGDVSRVRHELVEHDHRKQVTTQRLELFSDFLHDIRFGWRALRRAPAFTVAAVLTLALGIGANAAIFSVVDAILLRPLPFARPQELVSIGYGSGGEYLALQERLRSFSDIVAISEAAHPIHDGDEAVRVEGAAVTPNLFATLGATPLLGRLFTADEGRFGNHNVLILSHGLWQRQFGASGDILGKQVMVEGAPFTIVGVMPPDFHFPDRKAEYWQPFAFNPANIGYHWAVMDKGFVGRLRPGVTLEQAQREVADVWPTLRPLNPLWDPGDEYRRDIRIAPLQTNIVGEAGPLLWMLFGCVALVLLIGCINVANLLLARATSRQRELSVRAALGGGRGRLIRQLVTESLLLSSLGGLLGVLLAMAGVKWLTAAMPAGVPRAHEIAVNG
ncbi:MAG TPA: ABC transporter permease, partial [Gemmatimonadaceae bacterium]|nr:ABC transporter permease [Gemmatimonadaceae bacterium]